MSVSRSVADDVVVSVATNISTIVSGGDPNLIFSRQYSSGAGESATFARSTVGWEFDSSLNAVSRAINTPVISPNGLYMQPERENLIIWSNEIDRHPSSAGVTITDNVAISPDGTQNMSLLEDNGSAGSNAVIFTITSSASANMYSIKIYAKAGGPTADDGTMRIAIRDITGAMWPAQTCYIRNGPGSVNNSGSIKVITGLSDSEFSEIEIAMTVAATATNTLRLYCYIGPNSAVATDLYLWGASAFAHPIPGSYIETTGSAETQGADSLEYPISGFNDTEGSAEAVIFLDHEYGQDDLAGVTFVSVRVATASGLMYFSATDGSINSHDGTAACTVPTQWAYGDHLRIRVRWNTTGNVRAITTLKNSTTLLSDVDSNYDGGWSSDGTIRIGSGARPLWISSVKIWDIDKGADWSTET